jgi:hypothetical protein
MTIPAALVVPSSRDASAQPLHETIRIEHDRRRLLLRMLASVLALLATCSALIVAILHAQEPALLLAGVPQLDRWLRPHAAAAPWWTCTLLTLAAISALGGTLRNVFRLQDGDPALVISPRGLSFRSTVFGEFVHIPWMAIRGLQLRQRKQNRFLAVQVDEPERYAAQAGIFRSLMRSMRPVRRANEIDFTTPMSKRAWQETEALLRRYLAHFGQAVPRTDAGIAPVKASTVRAKSTRKAHRLESSD